MAIMTIAEREEALRDLAESIGPALSEVLVASAVERGELTIRVQAGAIRRVLTYLRDEPSCQFKILVDLCGVDYPARERRFDVVYHLLSLKHNQRIRVKIDTDEETPVPSVVDVFPAANWFEREVWDMFGIPIDGHPNMKRILMDDDWEGHPLRKDYPIGGEPVRFSGDE